MVCVLGPVIERHVSFALPLSDPRMATRTTSTTAEEAQRIAQLAKTGRNLVQEATTGCFQAVVLLIDNGVPVDTLDEVGVVPTVLLPLWKHFC